jgi:hypothetical protein
MPFDAAQVMETFSCATEENQINSLRQHQTVHLPVEGELWMTGDLHDHRTNLNKFLRAANLSNNPQRHVILHEVIHGEHFDASGAEDSWQTLLRVAELKCDLPNQVHFLLGNHDLSQIHGEGISKAGRNVCEAFTAGVKRDLGDHAEEVTVSITEFLLSLPLAVRAPNGLFFCHSLPTDSQIETFDFTIFDRELAGPDYARKKGSAYQLIWGRGVTPVGGEKFANAVGARIIITGHQPQESGFAVNGERHLILASDHNQGVFLPIDLSDTYEMAGLVQRMVKLVSLDV